MGIFNQMCILVLLMLAGVAARKTGLMDQGSNEKLSRVVINVAIPGLILTSITGEGISKAELGQTVLVTLLIYCVLGALGLALPKLLRVKGREAGTFRFMTMFGNVGFMGFPVAAAIFGPASAFYVAIFNVPFNILVFSIGISMISKEGGRVRIGPRLFLSPPMLAVLAALILYFLNLELWGPLYSAAELLGGMTTPAAMLILGSILADMPLKELFRDWRIYLLALTKLIVSPLLVWCVLRLFLPGDAMLLRIGVLLSGMPVATNATMLAIEYDGDQGLISKAVFMTTALCVITIPLLAQLLI